MQQSHSPIGYIVSFYIVPFRYLFFSQSGFCNSAHRRQSVRIRTSFLPFVFPSEEGCPLCVKLMGRSLSNPHVGIAYYGGTQMCFTVTTNTFFKTLMSKYAPHLNSQFRPIRCRKCWAPSLALGGDGAVITAIFFGILATSSRNHNL